jgi:hypothetical protein
VATIIARSTAASAWCACMGAPNSAADKAMVNSAATNRKLNVPNASGVSSRNMLNDRKKLVAATPMGPAAAST